MRLHTLLLLMASLCFSLSCSYPDSEEYFIKSAHASEGGLYRFMLDMTDSLAVYDLAFYTAPIQEEMPQGLKLEVRWELGDEAFTDIVYMHTGKGKVKETYRSGIRPGRPMVVPVTIQPMNAPEDFSGIGIILNRNGNGTRQTEKVR